MSRNEEVPHWLFFDEWMNSFSNDVPDEEAGYLIKAVVKAVKGEPLGNRLLDNIAKNWAEHIIAGRNSYMEKKKNDSDHAKMMANSRWHKGNADSIPEHTESIQQNADSIPTECLGNAKYKNTNKNTYIKEESFSIEKDKKKTSPRFVPPTLDEIAEYCAEKGYNIDPERFFNYYESNGWMVGKTKMTKWKNALANWVKTEKEKGYNHQPIKVEGPPLPPEGDIMRFFNGGGF